MRLHERALERWPVHALRTWACIGMLMIAVCAKAGVADATSQELPHTVAGLRLEALIRVFNGGNAAALERQVAENFAAADRNAAFATGQAVRLHKLREITGGLRLRRIEASSTSSLSALAQATGSTAWYRISIFTTAAPPAFTSAAPPYKIVGLGIDPVTAPADLAESGMDEQQVRERLDRLMDWMVHRDGFAGVVQVQKGEQTLYARGFGEADRRSHAADGLHTRFNLASITKMFTAVAIGQLVDSGKLRLSDTVGQLLPELAATELGRRVTVHHLLSHTSGIVGARDAIEKGLEQGRDARTIAQMMAPFVHAPLSFSPGQQFDYSNAGYVVLGAIIERLSGEDYHAYVQRHIFDAAGMRESGFYMPAGPHPAAMAIGYQDGPGNTRLANTDKLPLIGSPANMAFSTAGDMVRFSAALNAGHLLRPDTLDRFWTGVTERPDEVEYGYGARIEHLDGRRFVWHGGGAPGVTNRFEMIPAEGLTMVVLANVDTQPELIAYKLREWLSPRNQSTSPSAPRPPDFALTIAPAETIAFANTDTAIELQVSNHGGTAHAALVDLEIKNENGQKVEQQIVADQRLDGAKTKSFHFHWIPATNGRYHVSAGIFGPGWSSKLQFGDELGTIDVR
jgi:CubicO group peptidase (beta-lactamase class C family)